jgi:hypothetical protein
MILKNNLRGMKMMKTVKVSTEYSTSIRVKNKTFVLFLRRPDLMEVHGAGVSFTCKFCNRDNETEYDYYDDFIWDCVKAARKEERKKLKNK